MFKVVAVEGNRELRYYSQHAEGVARVQYYEDRAVTSPLMRNGYGILVYESLEHALCHNTPTTAVFRVEARFEMPLPPRRKLEYVKLGAMGSFDTFTDPKDYTLYWPVGTRMFKYVKLLERLR